MPITNPQKLTGFATAFVVIHTILVIIYVEQLTRSIHNEKFALEHKIEYDAGEAQNLKWFGSIILFLDIAFVGGFLYYTYNKGIATGRTHLFADDIDHAKTDMFTRTRDTAHALAQAQASVGPTAAELAMLNAITTMNMPA